MCLRYSVGDIRPPRTRCPSGMPILHRYMGRGRPAGGWPFQATYYACRTRVVEASQEQRPRAVQGALRRSNCRSLHGRGWPSRQLIRAVQEQLPRSIYWSFTLEGQPRGRPAPWKASPVEGQPRGRPAPWKASPAHKGVPRS